MKPNQFRAVLLIALSGIFLHPGLAQFADDAKRLADMAYMQDIEDVNCEEIISNREARICYNLKFQETDSILNEKLAYYLSTYENDSLKEQFVNHHNNWIKYRRFQSEMYSKGARGHFMGIRYLSAMTELSRLKIEELSRLMDEEVDMEDE